MIFVIDKSIKCECQESLLLFSNSLFRACMKGHFVRADYHTQQWIDETILGSVNYLGDYSCQILKKEMEFWAPTTLQRTHLRNVVVGTEDGMTSVDEMALLVDEPSEVVLENGRYDWAVIRTWASLYKNDRALGSVFDMLHQSIESHLLRGYNAGGCNNIENVLTVLMPIYGNLYRLRLTTIFDSDKKSPLDQTDEHAQLKNFLNEKRIEYHELQKREMENYFPLSVYEKAGYLNRPFDLDSSDLNWDYVDVFDKNVCSFLSLKKSDIESLCDSLTRQDLESIVGEEENEVKQILLHLAKYI